MESISFKNRTGIVVGNIFNAPHESLIGINLYTAVLPDEIPAIVDLFKTLQNTHQIQYVRILCQFGTQSIQTEMAKEFTGLLTKQLFKECKPEYTAIIVDKNLFPAGYFDFAAPGTVEVFESVSRADVKLSRLNLIDKSVVSIY